MRAILIGLGLLASTAPALALAPMTVAQFLTRAAPLERLGPAAVLHPDFAPLRDEVRLAGRAYRADIDAQRRAGRPLHSCPPAEARLDPQLVLAEFRRIPPAQAQRMTVKQGLYAVAKRRFPCAPQKRR